MGLGEASGLPRNASTVRGNTQKEGLGAASQRPRNQGNGPRKGLGVVSERPREALSGLEVLRLPCQGFGNFAIKGGAARESVWVHTGKGFENQTSTAGGKGEKKLRQGFESFANLRDSALVGLGQGLETLRSRLRRFRIRCPREPDFSEASQEGCKCKLKRRSKNRPLFSSQPERFQLHGLSSIPSLWRRGLVAGQPSQGWKAVQEDLLALGGRSHSGFPEKIGRLPSCRTISTRTSSAGCHRRRRACAGRCYFPHEDLRRGGGAGVVEYTCIKLGARC